MKNTKKTLLTLLSAFIILCSFTSCKTEEKKHNGDNGPKEEVEAPDQIVSLKQAKTTFDNYTTRRVPLIQKFEDSIDREGKYDEKQQEKMEQQGAEETDDRFNVARYTYYDYATIKQYMKYIEQEAAKANVEISTLRFYFSNYPNEEEFEGGRKIKHPRQNSIFIIPTTRKDTLDYGFFTIEKEDGQREAVLLTGQLDPYSPEGMGAIFNGNSKSYAGFVPNMTTPGTNTSAINIFHGDHSLILNEGSSAPPPNN